MAVADNLRIITPLNRHRWDLSLSTALQWAKEKGRVATIFISTHDLKDLQPTPALAAKLCMVGDNTKCPIPAIFPYVRGMPVCLNENKFTALQIPQHPSWHGPHPITETQRGDTR
ncbi:hypothetical protein QBC39DRAFT_312297 [Podospora conica]|nr:hypothetical protein QBC39DRAFT_312297 [Schizothecium conicum]